MEQVMSTIKPDDNKQGILKKIRRGKYELYRMNNTIILHTMSVLIAFRINVNFEWILLAVAKGQLPQSVMDEICEDMRSCDTKEDVMRIVYKGKITNNPFFLNILIHNPQIPYPQKVNNALVTPVALRMFIGGTDCLP